MLVFSRLVRTTLVATAALAGDPGGPLRVLRALPQGESGPAPSIEITFDRPVAGSLDNTIDPANLLSITPAAPGKVDWRDPVTLRFRPASSLVAGTTYRVSVAPRFAAMDGSRLPETFTFSFRVRGPRVLAGAPIAEDRQPQHLVPNQEFDLVVDATADESAWSRVYLEFWASCPSRGVIRLTPTSVRPIAVDDRYEFREAGGWERDRKADSLRRVVHFKPAKPLPRGCAGELVMPARLDAEADSLRRWPFSTYGPLTIKNTRCGWGRSCPLGPGIVEFSNPVKGAEVLKHVSVGEKFRLALSDTADERTSWALEGAYSPRTRYNVRVGSGLRDVFGQPLSGSSSFDISTSGYEPNVEHVQGRVVVERQGFGTLPVTYVNTDTLEVLVAEIPDSLQAQVLANDWNWDEWWAHLKPRARRQTVAVAAPSDRVRVFGVRLAPEGAAAPARLLAVQVTSPDLDSIARERRPIALVQVTDLGVHARIGVSEGAVWVTGVSDGRARRGARVRLRDAQGRLLTEAVTDSSGLARLTNYRRLPRPRNEEEGAASALSFQGAVEVSLGSDRAVIPVREWDPDLSPWRFNARAAWGVQRLPAAGAVFTERGIYRPGETVRAKAIARRGPLGRLVPLSLRDSLRWRFTDREGGVLRDIVSVPSRFGTADVALKLAPEAALGSYGVQLAMRHQGNWVMLAFADYRVAEYRPPEFLIDVMTDSAIRMAGDTVRANIEGRYLFGAPMGRAAANWTARATPISAWEMDVPGAEGYYLGELGDWFEEWTEQGPRTETFQSGQDTLDARGRLSLRVALPATATATRTVIEATVTDVNRQQVSGRSTFTVHPSAFYIGAKPQGNGWFWTAGKPVRIDIVTLRPDGLRVDKVSVRGTIVRREWHQVRRERGGYSELVGEWVSDTIARCEVRTSATAAVPCGFTPLKGGTYVAAFEAIDSRGRRTRTSFYRWAVGSDWVPWNDETQFKMDVVPDRARYSVGDTATVLFASPFVDAEAWITGEREGVLDQRRLRIASGTTTHKLPITEAYSPNAFVSIIVARGRSAPPGPLDDPGRPTIRVGYAELRVTPEQKRLSVTVQPVKAEYRPSDTAQVRLQVRDVAGRGQRSEVTLWAVDEGVLALTGYRTPDPIDLLYQPRGLGLRLASNLTAVAPQVPEGEKGRREPGGGGGGDGGDVLRTRFQTTAFFLGSVVTDSNGNGLAKARLPDNLTTFRVMAVAVTAGDRYGSGDAKLLVTRPLVARPALPRFVRPGDAFGAGVVVNHRLGGTPQVQVTAEATGVENKGSPSRSATLEPGRGREVRFDWLVPRDAADSVRLRFRAASGRAADGVESRLPVRPLYHQQAIALSGAVVDTQTATLIVPGGIDLARSRLILSLGGSPLAVIRGTAQDLRTYPYYCSEQVASTALPLLALLRAEKTLGAGTLLPKRARVDAEQAVATLVRRQRSDGGIGLWSATSWTTPWLSAYAGAVLVEAKSLGIAVEDSVLIRLNGYLKTQWNEARWATTPVSQWYANPTVTLSEQVMALDYLSRAGARDRAKENDVLRRAAQLAWEDRVRLALVLARGKDLAGARRLLQSSWGSVKVEGRRAVLPPTETRRFYIPSVARPAALLLEATLAVEPSHVLVGPLVETLLETGRSASLRWNTQDYAAVASALARYEEVRRVKGGRTVRILAGGGVVATATTRATAPRDTTISLAGLLPETGDSSRLNLLVVAERGTAPVFYYVTASLVPLAPPVRPEDRGIRVERWYERYEGGAPVTSVNAGELVRVRLRVTVPSERSFLVLDDPLPGGLEAVDLSLRLTGGFPDLGAVDSSGMEGESLVPRWSVGSWDGGWWTPFDHRELRDDRVVYVATTLWPGTYTATYVARATTPGTFVRPPAHAEEMYNPAVFGESDGGTFTVNDVGARTK